MKKKLCRAVVLLRKPGLLASVTIYVFTAMPVVGHAQEKYEVIDRAAAHENSDYPSGPPYSYEPDPTTWKFRDLRNELKNKMTGHFTVSTAGDLYYKWSVAKRMSPDLLNVLRNADLTIGNLEGGFGEDPQMRAQGVKEMGFDLVAPGESSSPAGAEKWFADGQVKIAGVGNDLTQARTPVYHETPKGLTAFLAACPGLDLCGTPAADAAGRRPAKAGVNPLHLTVWNSVTRDQMNQLRAIQKSMVDRRSEPGLGIVVPTDDPPDYGADKIILNRAHFIVGEKPGEVHYEMDPNDERAEVIAIRNTKETADFVAFHMHVHQNRFVFQQYSNDNYPPDFLRPFLHKLIDNGLDMYVGSGNHTMQGIELYKGRPIFYNQGNLGFELFKNIDEPKNGDMTNMERREGVYRDYKRPDTGGVAYVASTTYEDGVLTEIKIYPVDLNFDGKTPWSRESVPRTPTPERAKFILERIQEYSKPFGTVISIENGIGVIRVKSSETVPVSGDITDRGKKLATIPSVKPARLSSQ